MGSLGHFFMMGWDSLLLKTRISKSTDTGICSLLFLLCEWGSLHHIRGGVLGESKRGVCGCGSVLFS